MVIEAVQDPVEHQLQVCLLMDELVSVCAVIGYRELLGDFSHGEDVIYPLPIEPHQAVPGGGAHVGDFHHTHITMDLRRLLVLVDVC